MIDTTDIFLSKIDNWAKNIKLNFNTANTEILFFGKRKGQGKPNFHMRNKILHCVTELRYLGVIIQENLKWDSHIDNVTNKAKINSLKLKIICRRTWGIDKKSMTLIYNTAIRPTITYAAEIWATRLTIKQRNKIISIQRVALIGITNAYKTTSILVLQVIGNSYPLNLYLDMQRNIKLNTENLAKKEIKKQEERKLKELWNKR